MSLRKQTRDQLLQIALAKGMPVKHAAAQAGYGERTAHRRIRDQKFMLGVEKLQKQLFQRAIAVLSDSASDAAETLRSLLDDPSSAIRVNAADKILMHGAKLRDLAETEQRIQELESQVKIYLPSNGREAMA